jgi:hypothetical protein
MSGIKPKATFGPGTRGLCPKAGEIPQELPRKAIDFPKTDPL